MRATRKSNQIKPVQKKATKAFQSTKNLVQSKQEVDQKPVVKRQTRNSLPKYAPKPPLFTIHEIDLPVQKSEEQTKGTFESDQINVTFPGENSSKSNSEILEYSEEIWNYLTSIEERWTVDHFYLRNHKFITAKTRSFLVRTLYKVYYKYQLKRTTLFLGVQLMDFYFSRRFNLCDQHQTVEIAQTCLFMAMKYEEIYYPAIEEWVYNRNRNKIYKLEAEILKMLDFQLNHYTVQHFIDFIQWKKTKENSKLTQQTLFLMDLSLFDLSIRQFKTSEFAACLLAVGQQTETPPGSQKMALAVKWMIERNSESVKWLIENHYPTL